MFNLVVLVGNLTRDVELKTTPQGTSVAVFGIAVNTKYGEGKDEVYFGEIQAWGKQAESASKYLSKGSKVLVQGRLKTETWEKEGEKKSRTRIIASTIRFLSPKKDDVSSEETTGELEPF